jgi:hypothetical protein
LQNIAINDPVLNEVLRGLEGKGAIDWDNRLYTVLSDVSGYSPPTECAINVFQSKGPYQQSNIGFWRKWNHWSSTTAATVPHNNSTRLNKWRLNRDPCHQEYADS